jgi:hypothetical protein
MNTAERTREEIDESPTDDADLVRGIVYMITNQVTNKAYVGQTHTHKWNHGKWRPHGAQRRFNIHVMCALSAANPASNAFAEAIRQYGREAFTIAELERCSDLELSRREEFHITSLNTLVPHGYNTMGKCNVPSRKRGNTRNTGDLQVKRRKQYNGTDVLSASIKTVDGVAPKVLVFFETEDAKTARTMPRTTFSALVDGLDVAKASALAFAQGFTDNITIVEEGASRGDAARAELDLGDVIKLIARKETSHYIVYLCTEADERPTRMTTKTTRFVPLNGDFAEALQRLETWADEVDIPLEMNDTPVKISTKDKRKTLDLTGVVKLLAIKRNGAAGDYLMHFLNVADKRTGRTRFMKKGDDWRGARKKVIDWAVEHRLPLELREDGQTTVIPFEGPTDDGEE